MVSNSWLCGDDGVDYGDLFDNWEIYSFKD